MVRHVEVSGGVLDLRVRVEQRVIDEERGEQGHCQEDDEDAEADHALPVAAVQPPHLVGVPGQELGVLGGVAAYFWAVGGPEHAELLTWNTHQVWRLYRGNWQGMVGLGILVVFLAMALLAPFLIDHALLDPNAQIKDSAGNFYMAYHPPTASYYNWFGTDQVGQSVLAEFIWSSRISLLVGLLAAFMSTVLGAGIGIAAGFYGGWQGEVWMRLTDVFLVIPWLPLAMVLVAAWGQNFFMIIIIIGITSWPGTARVVRS